ncbi:hypothetical protein N7471_000920 [Penicillium samsonianum]|uniref:uncharacterized protein n=1 Tax=Penicillium samsonianum TaxID=1882272 RepID=UPI002547CEF2|nr:uncharacterized protein N7471_000920 [Penicillium samsonianum]KAJ6149721.1 hypothetical protein N7471_000920 [Penicillium samsonianum]
MAMLGSWKESEEHTITVCHVYESTKWTRQLLFVQTGQDEPITLCPAHVAYPRTRAPVTAMAVAVVESVAVAVASENRYEDIKLKDGDDDLTISVTMSEEGLQDNAELPKRVEDGAIERA